MVFGLLRIKNESRWIGRVVDALKPVCDTVIVLDDYSTDGTPDICREHGAVVYTNPRTDGTVQEATDKDYLLARVWEHGANIGDTAIMVDGDEILHHDDIPRLRELIEGPGEAYAFRIVYLWNDEHHWRADGIYRRFSRPSMFKLTSRTLTFKRTGMGDGKEDFHCSSVPESHISNARPSGVRLLHLGYLHKEDRIRKYRWYNERDGQNPVEDGYRHVAQGDLPELPADAQFRWAGPIHLLPLT